MDYGFNAPLEYKYKGWWNVQQPVRKIERQHFGFEVEQGAKMETGYSKVKNEETEFKIEIPLGPFSKEDVQVKTHLNTVTIHFEHRIKREGKGIVSRKMERTYYLPEQCDLRKIQAFVSSDKVNVSCRKVLLQERKSVIINLTNE